LIDFGIAFGKGSAYPDVPKVDGALELILSEGDKRVVYQNLVRQRTDALFTPRVIHDPLTGTKANVGFFPGYFKGALLVGPFKIVPKDFLAAARRQAPTSPEATVSAFASWVYSIYGPPGGSELAMKKGLEAERLIFGIGSDKPYLGARSILSSCDNAELRRSPAGWRQVHCGLHLDPDKDEIPFFELDTLTVRGKRMRAAPDLVYRNVRTGAVVIVEIKLTLQSVPSNLWPNIWAQLWCYSHLPVAVSAPELTVVGEVWGELHKWERSQRQNRQWLALRAMVHRNPRLPSYHRFFGELFNIYRGVA
jgi:hypothetical protein